MTTEVRRVVAGAVASELERQGHEARWLSTHAGIEAGDLERVLRSQRDLTVSELARIARALEVPIVRLLP
ncbi:hypothetical protein [Microbacterium sp. NPDC089695]|uniref:hypothetical protein n=1 Tax=Microbacterium sp. NPDC089695 TaxID=3364198 RepID=UPI0038087CF0